MEVLYHHRTRATGAEGVHIRGVQEALRMNGYTINDISVLSGVAETNEARVQLKKKLVDLICFCVPNIFFRLLNILYNFRALRVGSKAIKTLKTEPTQALIYERSSYFCFALAFLANRHKIPYVLEINGTSSNDDVRRMWFKGIARRIEEYVFAKADVIVVVSKYLQDMLIKDYNVAPKKIVITPNAVDPKKWILAKNVRSEIPCWDKFERFTKDKIVIGFTGIFVPWHGLDFLIEAYRDIINEIELAQNRLVLVLVGDGPIRKELELQIQEYSLEDRVMITGKIDHDFVPYFVDLFDIATMPDSNVYGSPMKIFEYMIMAKPIVAPNYEPIAEVLSDRETALLFPPKNLSLYSSAMRELIQNEKFRTKLGNAARQQALNHYTWESNVKKIVGKLNAMLEEERISVSTRVIA